MNKLQELGHLKATPFKEYKDYKFEKDLEEACKYSLLTHLTFNKEHYIEKWSARDGYCHRYLLVKVSEETIQDYCDGNLTMLDFLKYDNEKGFIVDYDSRTEKHTRYAFETFDEVPDAYLPKEGIYHDPELRPGFCEEDT